MPKPNPAPKPGLNGHHAALPPSSNRIAMARPTGRVPELAREPDLMAAIGRDLAAVGVVGEEVNGPLVYVAYTSRQLDDPLAVVTRGGSSTGKSTLLTATAKLFPPESKCEFMQHTDASFFNGPEDELTHKILITGERRHGTDDATRDANRMIRQLLSEKRISRRSSVPGANGRGRWKTEEQVRLGPVAYAESTTAGSIFDEDLSRMLELYTDDSPGQTRAVQHAVAGRYAPDGPAPGEAAAAVERHHRFQESLERRAVVIPFARRLAEGLPAEHPRCRRLAVQVFAVLEAVTLLHQHTRGRDAAGRLVATAADYGITRRLVLGPLHAAVGLGKDHARLMAFAEKLADPGDEFDSAAAARKLDANSRKVCQSWLRRLADAGVLKCIQPAVGNRPARWRVTGRHPDDLLLPGVDDLAAATDPLDP